MGFHVDIIDSYNEKIIASLKDTSLTVDFNEYDECYDDQCDDSSSESSDESFEDEVVGNTSSSLIIQKQSDNLIRV